MKEEYMKAINSIVNNCDEYLKNASTLKWSDSVITYCDASRYPSEKQLHLVSIEYPKNYLKQNFESAFVQTILTTMAYFEELNYNFWSELSIEKRKEILSVSKDLYIYYICFDRLKMQKMTYAEMLKDIKSWFPWAENEIDSKNSTIPELPKKAKEILFKFSKADAVLLGGNGLLDESWIAVDEDAILYVNFCCTG